MYAIVNCRYSRRNQKSQFYFAWLETQLEPARKNLRLDFRILKVVALDLTRDLPWRTWMHLWYIYMSSSEKHSNLHLTFNVLKWQTRIFTNYLSHIETLRSSQNCSKHSFPYLIHIPSASFPGSYYSILHLVCWQCKLFSVDVCISNVYFMSTFFSLSRNEYYFSKCNFVLQNVAPATLTQCLYMMRPPLEMWTRRKSRSSSRILWKNLVWTPALWG